MSLPVIDLSAPRPDPGNLQRSIVDYFRISDERKKEEAGQESLAKLLGIPKERLKGTSPAQQKIIAENVLEKRKQDRIANIFGISPQYNVGAEVPEDGGADNKINSKAEAVQAENAKPLKIENLSYEKIAEVAALDPKLGESLYKSKKLSDDRNEKVGEKNYKLAEPLLKESQEIASTSSSQKVLLDTIEDSVLDADLSQFSQDWWADRLGIPNLATMEGTAFRSALKEQLVGSLKGIPGKGLNQFLEKILKDSLAKVGQSREANLSAVEVARSKRRILDKKAEVINDLHDEHLEKYGKINHTFSREVQKRMDAEAEKETNFVRERMEKIQSGKYVREKALDKLPPPPEGQVRIVLPDGTVHVGPDNEEVLLRIQQEYPDVEIRR